MILTEQQITTVIPHRFPFVMIGNLIAASETAIESDFTISGENVLCEEGYFSFPGLIENIAQTCAAGFGFIDSQKGGKTKIGFIGAINKLKAVSRPLVGQIIHTKVETLTSFNNVILIKGANYCGDDLLVECEMKIVIAE